MALINKLFQSRRGNLHLSNKRTPDTNTWVKPKYDADQIRLIVFVENDIKGRILLFDSKAIKRADECDKPCSFHSRFKCKSKLRAEDGQVPKYKIIKAGSDVKMLEEMMFGSVAMSYKGSSLKVHSIKTPVQLMLTKVFILEKPKTIPTEADGDLGSLANSSCDLSSPKHILRTSNPIASNTNTPSSMIAQSVPVDVPLPNYSLHDSGIASSFASSGSFAPTFASSGSSSISLSSTSLNSLQRRWLRNQTTSIEGYLKKRSSVEHGKAVATGAVHRKDKVGIGILFPVARMKGDESARMFQNFFFTHITLFEGRVAKLEAAVERGFYSRTNFIHIVMQAFASFQQEIYDLYTTPRLTDPVWLNMVSYTNYRYVLCEQFIKELMGFYKYDTKSTHFFLSNVVTAVLRYHLAWVPTVIPAGATPSRAYLNKHSVKWMDTLTKTHPYNPLWAQLGDVYGAIGNPQCLSRTIVVGKKSDLVNRLIYILSYFIRCSEVYGNKTNVSSSLLANLKHMEFDQNTVYFEPEISRCETLSQCTSIDRAIDVKNTIETPISTASNSLVSNGTTVSNVGSQQSHTADILSNCCSESSSVKSVQSVKNISTTLKEESDLVKIIKNIDKIDFTDKILDVLCVASDIERLSDGEEANRLIRDEILAVKNDAKDRKCPTKNGLIVDKHVNKPDVNSRIKQLDVRNANVSYCKLSDQRRLQTKNNLNLKPSQNMENVQSISAENISKTDASRSEQRLCRLSSDFVCEDAKIMDVRHVGHQSSMSLSDLPTVTSPTIKVRSLLTEQLNTDERLRHNSFSGQKTCASICDSNLLPKCDTIKMKKCVTTDQCNAFKNAVTEKLHAEFINERSDSMFDEYFDGVLEAKTIDDIPVSERIIQYPLIESTKWKPCGCSVQCKCSCNVNQNIDDSHKCVKMSISCQESCGNTRNASTMCCHSRSSTPTDSHCRHISGTQSCDSDLDPLVNCTEISLPQLEEACHTTPHVQSFDQNLGRSLMAKFSDHYLPDFVLHGTSDPAIHSKVAADLAASVQQSVLDDPVSEAIAVVADTDKWTVNVLSSHVTSDPHTPTGWVASSLVCNLLESVYNLWKLKMSPEFCIMHLEDRLQEIYYKSHIFIAYVQSNPTANLSQLCSMLGLDMSDLPLLLAISTTHACPCAPLQKSSRSNTQSSNT